MKRSSNIDTYPNTRQYAKQLKKSSNQEACLSNQEDCLSNQEACSICLDKIIINIYQCSNKHYLCGDCLQQYFKKKAIPTCPLCREIIPSFFDISNKKEKYIMILKLICERFPHIISYINSIIITSVNEEGSQMSKLKYNVHTIFVNILRMIGPRNLQDAFETVTKYMTETYI